MVLQELGSFTVKEDRFLVSPYLRPVASEMHQQPCFCRAALWVMVTCVAFTLSPTL